MFQLDSLMLGMKQTNSENCGPPPGNNFDLEVDQDRTFFCLNNLFDCKLRTIVTNNLFPPPTDISWEVSMVAHPEW